MNSSSLPSSQVDLYEFQRSTSRLALTGYGNGIAHCQHRNAILKVSKGAKIRNGYNQVPHLTQGTNGKVTNSQLDTTNENQEVSPFPAGDHKAHINRRSQRHSKHKTEKTLNIHKRSTALERSIKYFTGGLKPFKCGTRHRGYPGTGIMEGD